MYVMLARSSGKDEYFLLFLVVCIFISSYLFINYFFSILIFFFIIFFVLMNKASLSSGFSNYTPFVSLAWESDNHPFLPLWKWWFVNAALQATSKNSLVVGASMSRYDSYWTNYRTHKKTFIEFSIEFSKRLLFMLIFYLFFVFLCALFLISLFAPLLFFLI